MPPDALRVIGLAADWYWEQDAQFRFTVCFDLRGPVPIELPWVVGYTRWDLPGVYMKDEEKRAIRATQEAHRPFDDVTDTRLAWDGSVLVLKVSGRPVFDAAGNFCGYRGVVRKVIRRDSTGPESESADQRFRRLGELWSDWYWEQDEQLRFTLLSPGVEKILGYAPEEVIGKKRWELTLHEMPATYWAEHRALLEQHKPFSHEEIRCHARNGSIHYVSISGHPRFDAQGIFRGYHGISRDVTAQVLARQRLEEAERRYRSLVELSPDAIFIHQDKRVVFVNSAAVRLLGATAPADIIGRLFIDFIHPDCRAVANERARRVYEQQTEAPLAEQIYLRMDGSAIPVEVKSAPLQYGDQRAIQTVVRDISERKWREAETQRLAQQAMRQQETERANQAKSHFLAAASHDLRQPVHALGLLLEHLRLNALPPDSARIVDHMEETFTAMDGLLSALLNISRLDAGVVAPQAESFAINDLLAQLASEYDAVAQSKGLRLRIHPSSATVISDRTLLQQIVANLLANATRYTEHGGVLIGCRKRGSKLVIEVWDTGIGIPPDKHQEVFQEFVQLNNPARDRSQGLGLGLAIVARTAQLLGHELSLRSRVGRGSVFGVEVPLGVAAEMKPPAIEEPMDDSQPLQCNVLIVDDEVSILRGLTGLLECWGCRVLAAQSAQDALRRLEDEDFIPDVVITDYRLRDGDNGINVIDLLHKSLGVALPCAMITGDTAPEPLRAAEMRGIRLLHKPVRARALRELIEALLSE